MDTNFHDILTIFKLKLANMVLAESSFFEKNTLAKKSQTNFKNYGWPRTKFSKMAAHRPISKKWLATNQNLKNGCSPTNFKKKGLATNQNLKNGCSPNQFQKLWLATDQNFENGCSPTNFKKFGWPPTKFNLISVHTCKLAKISVHMLKNS